MNKKKIIFNSILLLLLVTLIVLICVLIKKDIKASESKQENEISIRVVNYGSQVSPVGYMSAESIVTNFINAYNEKNGKEVVSLFDLVGTYIYSECEKDIDKFDQTYEDILAVGSSTYSDEDFMIMQYSLQAEESRMIKAISDVNVELSLVSYSEIEDVTKYISKFTAEIHTYSESEAIDQTDILEFILLKSEGAYYLIDYYTIGE